MKQYLGYLLFILLFGIDTLSAQTEPTSSLDSLLVVFEQRANQKAKAKAAIQLSKYYATKDLEKAGTYARAALRTTTNEDSLRIDALDQMARYYFFSSQLDSAEHYFLEAKAMAQEKGDDSTSASLGISIASLNLRQSKYEQAITLLTESTKFFEEGNDELNTAKCYINMGTAYAELEQFSQAISYSKKSLEIFKREGQDQFTLIALPNLATQFVKVGDTINGIKTFLEAEELAKEKNNGRSLALTYNNLGDLHMSRKEYDKAKNYLEQSLQLKQSLNINKGQDNNYHNLGYISAQQGNHHGAISYYKQALPNADYENKIALLQKLRDSHKALGQYKVSLQYAENAQSLRDSVTKISNLKNFAEVSEKYEASVKENQILQLQNENQELELTKNKSRSLLLSSLGLLGILSMFSFFYFKNLRRKKKIAEQQHLLDQQIMLEKLKVQELDTIDRIIEGQEEERHKIAADLHDSLGSKMATLKLYMENLADTISGDKSMIVKATELTDTTYQEIRDMSHAINSGVLTDKGLIPALKNMASFISNSNQLSIQIIDVDIQNRLENSAEIQLFRIIQELVTNIIKHAKATEATIQIVDHQDSLNILVEDNGKGFDVQQSTNGMGLNSINSRVKNFNGTVEFDSSESIGTSVMINIPV